MLNQISLLKQVSQFNQFFLFDLKEIPFQGEGEEGLFQFLKVFPHILPAPIQKIYSTTNFMTLGLRFPGTTVYLYLGRGKMHGGAWHSFSAPPSTLRGKDGVLEYLRHHIIGARLLPLIMDPFDRVMVLPLIRGGLVQFIGLFYRGQDAYFVHLYPSALSSEREDPTSYEVFCSWEGRKRKVFFSDISSSEKNKRESFPSSLVLFFLQFFQDVGRRDSLSPVSLSDHEVIPSLEEILKSEQFQIQKKNGPKKTSKSLKKKYENINKDLSRIQNYHSLLKLAQSPQSLDNYAEGKNILYTYKFYFTPEMSIHARASLIYEKVKSLKKGEEILQKRLKDVKLDLSIDQQLQEGGKEIVIGASPSSTKNKIPVRPIPIVWGRNPHLKGADKNSDHSPNHGENKDYLSLPGFPHIKGKMGKTAQENDFLRKTFSKPDDWWFHLENQKGAHLFLKGVTPQDFTLELFKLVASYLLGVNDKEEREKRHLEVDLIYTQVKNLKGVKGRPGAVRFNKEKRLRVQL